MSDKKRFAVVMLISSLFVAWILHGSLSVMRINNLLEQDAELGQYPYRFRVLRTQGQVAIMGTLHSPELPAIHALRKLYPELSDLPPDSPRLQKAQRELARMQARAQQLVLEHTGLDLVRWVLDENWLRLHGIRLESPQSGPKTTQHAF